MPNNHTRPIRRSGSAEHGGVAIKTTRILAIAVTTILALVVLSPAAMAAEPGGTATGSNTLLHVGVGSTLSVDIGKDYVQSLWSTTRSATAEIDLGKAGTTKIEGGAKRTASKGGDSGTQSIGTGTKAVAGLASLTVSGGSITTNVSSNVVTGAADYALGNINLLTGLATWGTAKTATTSQIESTKATVSRTLTIGQANLLSLGDLLDRLDIDPLALACSAIESAGAELGVETSAACEQLDAATTSTADGQAALAAAKSDLETALSGFDLAQVEADEAAITALTCDLADLPCQVAALATISGINSTEAYGVDLTGMGFEEAQDAMLVRFAEIKEQFSDLGSVDEGIEKAATGTCADVRAALADVSAAVPDVASTLNSIADAINEACNTLADTISDLMGTPLLSMNAITVGLEVTATATNPVAKVTGTVGSLKVGTLAPVGQTIDLSKTGLSQAVATVRTAIAQALAALNIGLPTPELEIMKSATSKGQRADGTWHASASLTALHLGIPSVTVTLPDVNPLGLLGGTGGFALPAGGPSIAAQHTTPRVDVDAAKFTGASTFLPGPDGTLPVTGAEDAAFLAILFLCAAAVVRRFTLVRV